MNIKFEQSDIEEMTLQEIMELNPSKGREIKDVIFKKHTDNDESHVCADCGKKSNLKALGLETYLKRYELWDVFVIKPDDMIMIRLK